MSNSEILDRLSSILGALLADASIELAADTKRTDIPAWDSFQYINFIVAVEVEFGVKFQVGDVESFVTVGDIVAEIFAQKH